MGCFVDKFNNNNNSAKIVLIKKKMANEDFKLEDIKYVIDFEIFKKDLQD